MTAPAVLALGDGSIFKGQSIGAAGNTTGEVVFNTAITGYQEILTDPSYARQIVTLTYPHIGNTGVNAEDMESAQIYAAGLVVRDLSMVASSWRAAEPLGEFLQRGTRGRDRRHRHAPPDAAAAREGRAVRLHHDRRAHRRGGGGARRARLPGTQGHGSRQGGHARAGLSVERRQHRPRAGAIAARARSACTWSPTTTASSATSCGCWPIRAAASRVVPATDHAPPKCWRSIPMACSCPTAPAIRSPATTRSRPSRELLDDRHADLRHLPRTPAAGSGQRRQDRQDEVRPSRRQPSGAGARHRPCADHQPEPRLRGR